MKRSALFNPLERILVVSPTSIWPKNLKKLSVLLLRVLLAVILTLKLTPGKLYEKNIEFDLFAFIRRQRTLEDGEHRIEEMTGFTIKMKIQLTSPCLIMYSKSLLTRLNLSLVSMLLCESDVRMLSTVHLRANNSDHLSSACRIAPAASSSSSSTSAIFVIAWRKA